MTRPSRTLRVAVMFLSPIALAGCGHTEGVPGEDAPKPPHLLHTLSGHQARVTCVEFSPDSRLLASSCLKNTAIVWDAATGKELSRWVHGAPDDDAQVYAVRFHPADGTVFTCCRDGRVRVWEVGKKEPKAVLTGDKRGMSKLAIDPTGKRMLTEFSSHTGPVLWDLKTAKHKLLAKSESLNDFAFSPDGKRFAVAHSDNPKGEYALNVWDVEKEEVVGSIKGSNSGPSGSFNRVCFSPDGKLMAGVGMSPNHSIQLYIWDAEKLTEVTSQGKTLRSDGVGGLQFTPDGKYLLFGGGSYDNETPGEVAILDVAAKKWVASFAPHVSGCTALAISPDGKRLATGSMLLGKPLDYACEVRIWNLAAILAEVAKKKP